MKALQDDNRIIEGDPQSRTPTATLTQPRVSNYSGRLTSTGKIQNLIPSDKANNVNGSGSDVRDAVMSMGDARP